MAQYWKISLNKFFEIVGRDDWGYVAKKRQYGPTHSWEKLKDIEGKSMKCSVSLDRDRYGDCQCIKCKRERGMFWRIEWEIRVPGATKITKQGCCYICGQCYDSIVEYYFEKWDHTKLRGLFLSTPF